MSEQERLLNRKRAPPGQMLRNASHHDRKLCETKSAPGTGATPPGTDHIKSEEPSEVYGLKQPPPHPKPRHIKQKTDQPGAHTNTEQGSTAAGETHHKDGFVAAAEKSK
jgi:hypothetical protein